MSIQENISKTKYTTNDQSMITHITTKRLLPINNGKYEKIKTQNHSSNT